MFMMSISKSTADLLNNNAHANRSDVPDSTDDNEDIGKQNQHRRIGNLVYA